MDRSPVITPVGTTDGLMPETERSSAWSRLVRMLYHSKRRLALSIWTAELTQMRTTRAGPGHEQSRLRF